MSLDPFKYQDQVVDIGKKIKIDKDEAQSIFAANGFFDPYMANEYERFIRFPYFNPDYNTYNREFLFFTKPDLYLMDGTSIGSATLRPELQVYPFFQDCFDRYKPIMHTLQYSLDSSNKNPFMNILSNRVTSRLNLPSISADTMDSSNNIYGTSIQYRGHSVKSDNGYDFSLSFKDTKYREIYRLLKIYDEYIKLIRLGYISPKQDHIINNIMPEQFSIYKIVVGEDMETIIFAAKVTGVFFTDVPRSEFDDAPNDGFKYGVSFHGQFPEDDTPVILSDFNKVTLGKPTDTEYFDEVYNSKLGIVCNNPVVYPVIVKSALDPTKSKRTRLGLGDYEYKLKWINYLKN